MSKRDVIEFLAVLIGGCVAAAAFLLLATFMAVAWVG